MGEKTINEPLNKRYPSLLVLLASTLAFGLDRISKVIIVEMNELISVGTISIWPPYFQLVMAWNKGVNFGVLSGLDARWILVTFSVAVSIALAIWARKLSGLVLPLAAGTVIGGALGNAYDRIVYGAVADYLNVSCCSINNPYSFNVADILIFAGAIILITYNTKNNQN